MPLTPATERTQRRTVIVKRSLQFKYIGITLASALAVTLISSGDTFYAIYKIALMDNPALAPLLHQIQSMILIKLLLFLGIIFLVALFFSHRFAGPIYRFEKSAQIIASGNLTHRVSLRTGDELLELQEEFNGMVASLQALLQKDRTLIQRLASRLDQTLHHLQDETSGYDMARLREDIKSFKTELEHINSGFKV